MGLQSLGSKEVANCWSELFTLGNFCPRRWTQPGEGGCGEGDGCSGSAVFHESRARSHQKPARSNSKLSVEPRQYWGASSRDFLTFFFFSPHHLFLFFCPLFLYIHVYMCVYLCINIHTYIYIYTHTQTNWFLYCIILLFNLLEGERSKHRRERGFNE